MDDATHLVNDDCGHWTIRRILALGQTHTGAAIHVTRIPYSEKFSRMRKIEHFANNIFENQRYHLIFVKQDKILLLVCNLRQFTPVKISRYTILGHTHTDTVFSFDGLYFLLSR